MRNIYVIQDIKILRGPDTNIQKNIGKLGTITQHISARHKCVSYLESATQVIFLRYYTSVLVNAASTNNLLMLCPSQMMF